MYGLECGPWCHIVDDHNLEENCKKAPHKTDKM